MARRKLSMKWLVFELLGMNGTRDDLLSLGLTDREIERLRRNTGFNSRGQREADFDWRVMCKIEAAKHSEKGDGDGGDKQTKLYY